MAINIAIDGPAGAGKSTIAKMIASKYSFIYVDTGAMYRTMALFYLRQGTDVSDEAAVSGLCDDIKVDIQYIGGKQHLILNGEDVTDLIRTEEVGNTASIISVFGAVREKLVNLQKELAKTTDVVMDGRDIGTVVLPDARVKIYLTASVETRAKRRYDELKAKGETPDLSTIEEDIRIRDERDMTREISPLRKADDAVEVDSSAMTIDEVVDAISDIIEDRL